MSDIERLLTECVERLERIEERQIADREMRELGHRIVWGEDGRCNVPGMPVLSGDALKKQLERQRKFY